MEEQIIQAVGKRKNAVAVVYLTPGSGKITVNGRLVEDYFKKEISIYIINQPLVMTDSVGKYNITVSVKGGGLSGQRDALRHGISRALVGLDEANRGILKKAGLLTRDAREKERKKYGLAGARRGYQFSKR